MIEDGRGDCGGFFVGYSHKLNVFGKSISKGQDDLLAIC
jgi:hypothetical protein